jgi:hypoxanthine phosphoribosyltransferase
VDEISVTGETLRMAKREAEKKGARKVKTLTLYVHSDSYRPNWYALESDALIIQPWDYEVLDKGKFIVHPEYQEQIDKL